MAFKLERRGKEVCLWNREGRGSWIQVGRTCAGCGSREHLAHSRKEKWFSVAGIEDAYHGQVVNELGLDLRGALQIVSLQLHKD